MWQCHLQCIWWSYKSQSYDVLSKFSISMVECNHSHPVACSPWTKDWKHLLGWTLSVFKRTSKDVIKSQWPSTSSILRPLLCLPLCLLSTYMMAAATASTPFFCFFSVAAFLWLRVYRYQAGQAHSWHLFCLGHWSINSVALPLLVPLHC